jgi:hypothetical protein
MKKTITLVVDCETTVPRLLNQVEFEVVATLKDEIWVMIEKEKENKIKQK